MTGSEQSGGANRPVSDIRSPLPRGPNAAVPPERHVPSMSPPTSQSSLLLGLERSPDLVLVLSPEHVVLHANPAARNSFGLGEVVGQSAPDLCDALSREVLEHVTRELEHRRSRRVEDHDESVWW